MMMMTTVHDDGLLMWETQHVLLENGAAGHGDWKVGPLMSDFPSHWEHKNPVY